MTSIPRALGAGILAVAVAACGPQGGAVSDTGTIAIEASRQQVRQAAGEVLADRHEAQGYLDAARTAFLANDAPRAALSLKQAADFSRNQAAETIDPAAAALLASAGELEVFADRIANDGLTNVAPLDSAFVRLHLAEAQFHCLRAEAAWKIRNAGATSAEMIMLADHFERAKHDAGAALTDANQQALARARSVAARLAARDSVPAAEVQGALSALDKDVHDLQARVTRGK